VSLSRQILLGLAGGLAVGLFFGEKAAFLELPAKAFVQLLQVTVLPYVIGSLIVGVARGTPEQARRLASKGGAALLLLWTLALVLVFLTPLGLPPEKGGSFFATVDGSRETDIDWIELYIPSNPFRSLANNLVPAVVVFSVLLGVALLGVKGKEKIVEGLQVVNQALGRAGSLVVKLTPLGLFAIAGHAAGTLRVDEFERLQAYLVVYVGLALVLTLWLLPAVVSALTGLSYRRIVSLSFDPLLTAFVTANLFVVLPLLAERGKALLAESGLGADSRDEAVDVLVPASFTFPHSAKLLSLAFVLFAGWFVGAPVPVGRYPALAGAGLLSLFGSIYAAVPFLLDLVRLPADLFQLFMVSSVVNSRFGSAAAAMHVFALALLGAHLMAGRLRLRPRRLAGVAGGTVAILALFFGASRLVLSRVLPGPESATAALDRLRLSGAWGVVPEVEVESAASPASPAPVTGRRLDEIRQRGALRFGFTEDEVPWAFRNGRGEVVGLEIDLVLALASEMGLRLDLVPVPRERREAALASGACDLAAGRVQPTARVLASRSFAEEAWAFVVRDHVRGAFATIEGLRRRPGLRIAVIGRPSWMQRLAALLPRAQIVPVGSPLDFIRAEPGRLDALYTGSARGTALSLVHPEFTAVVPEPGLGSVLIAFAVPEGEEELLARIDAWIDQERASGLLEAKLDYWVRGKGAKAEQGPRWSVARDVLGWWRE
jgi:Na+/H+-dicarboxylate symporter/ABC-type amino acid transport substrate-binding protein